MKTVTPKPYHNQVQIECIFIEAEKLKPALTDLQRITTKTIILTMPWGVFQHGVAHDNPHTRHKSHWYPKDFQKLRYRTACIGPPNKPGSQLQAWKRL